MTDMIIHHFLEYLSTEPIGGVFTLINDALQKIFLFMIDPEIYSKVHYNLNFVTFLKVFLISYHFCFKIFFTFDVRTLDFRITFCTSDKDSCSMCLLHRVQIFIQFYGLGS